jgi:amino acid adenylation domain-containing protein
LLAVFKALLHRYAGHDEIVVGTSAANRLQPGGESIIGPLANLLALRTHLSGDLTFARLVKELSNTVADAYKYQALPFDKLVMELNPRVDMSRTALFDVLFCYEASPLQVPDVAGLSINHMETNLGWGKYDLNMLMQPDNDSLTGVLVYNADYYDDTTISRFTGHYCNLLAGVLANPDLAIAEYDLLSGDEQRQLLEEWNGAAAGYPCEATVDRLFEEQVERTPDAVALVVGDRQTTYRQLNHHAGQVAEYLRSTCHLRPGELVCLLLTRSETMIAAMLGVLKAGGGYAPIDPGYPGQRIRYILDDSGSRLVIDDQTVFITGKHETPPVKNKPGDTAYVIYTSGTTGRPKGCLIAHRNVVRLFKNDRHPFAFGGRDTWIMAHSYCFDFSVWEIYGALLNGGRLVMPDRDTVRDTGGFLDMIKQHGVTVLNQTPAAFYRLIEEEKSARPKRLHSHLDCVIFGGDKLEPAYLNDWLSMYSLDDIKLINMYGITETTVHVTYYYLTEEDIRSAGQLSPIGIPLPDTTVYILNERLRPAPIGVRGELYVGGGGVSVKGYLNRPGLTGEKFLPDPYAPYGDDKNDTPGKLYKSGDLCRWLADGRLDFRGRIDHQVKIRGFRIEPGEIENRLLGHADVKEAAVVLRGDSGGDRYLCGYIVPANPGTFESLQDMSAELREHLQQTLPDYMVPSFFVSLDKMPLTANNKLDRAALPAPEAAAMGTAYVAPRSELEKKLADTWSQVLKIERIGIDDNFFDLGGHSLKATTLTAKIHKALDVKIPLAVLFKNPFIRSLAEYIEGEAGGKFIAIQPVEEKEYYPASPVQKRLYILQQMDLGSTGYNMPAVVLLSGVLDEERLEDALRRLIMRHESLRTSFGIQDSDPVQRVHERVEFQNEYYDLSTGGAGKSGTAAETIGHFIRPFDLTHAPLMRVGAIKIETDARILVVDMHHIITDGTSTGIFIQDLTSLYAGEELTPLRIQYRDFACWQNTGPRQRAVKEQEAYWLKEFAGEIPVLDLITDFPRPLVQNFQGHSLIFELGGEETQDLKQLAREEDVTLYMVLLAVNYILYAKLSQQEDIVIGTPVAGRGHEDLQPVIGMFVNTLALRNYPAGEKTFRQFLKEIKQRTLDAFENQDYPFDELVEKVAGDRESSRNPLFDVMFALQNMDIPDIKLEGLTLSSYEYENPTARFDLTLSGMERGNGMIFRLEYRTSLFKEELIREFVDYFKNIIAVILADSEIRLAHINISRLEDAEMDSDFDREMYDDFEF